MSNYKTEHRMAKEKADMAFYKDYMKMTEPNRNAEGVKVVDIEPIFAELMKKHHIYARSTCYAIVKRVEARLAAERK